MKTFGLVLITLVLLALHQDVWFFRTARPMAFGFLPPGLWYHALYAVLSAVLMWVLVRLAWPAHLEAEAESHEEPKQ
ncbi:MAG: DUF3311 domain-containing protein [Bryobacteraceae bacterium]|nr:DUF3311 domain-containing protein [Bryobacteraceae bacterium]